MAKIYGNLTAASLENLASDPANVTGRVYYNTTTNLPKFRTNAAWDTFVGEASTQTLSNKSVSDALTFAEIATPSNPAAGFNKLYCKNDDKFYRLNSAGVEVDISTVSNPVVATFTSGGTPATTDDIILCDTTSGSFTLDLPTAVGNSGKIYQIKKTNSSYNVLIINPNGTQTIDGALTFNMVTQYEQLRIVSDGANWHILSRLYPQTWASYTATITGTGGNPTKGTTSVDVGYWRRVGDSIEIKYSYLQTAGSGNGGTGDYLFSLPTGITVDTTKLPGGTSNPRAIGHAQFREGTGNTYLVGSVYLYDSTHVRLVGLSDTLQLVAWGAVYGNFNLTNSEAQFIVTLPVSGWEP